MNDKIIQIGGKSYEKCSIVMLSTEEKITFNHTNTEIESCSSLENNLKELKKGNVTRNPFKVPITIIENGKMINSLERCDFPSKEDKFYHLYILSDEEIKEGDWCFDLDFKRVFYCSDSSREKYLNSKKIITTTDESLVLKENISKSTEECWKYTSLPRPSDDFITAFVKAQGKIIEVLVEYEFGSIEESYFNDNGDEVLPIKLKVSKDNTITIKPIQEEKTSWSREEVKKLMESWMVLPKTPESINNWIKENL